MIVIDTEMILDIGFAISTLANNNLITCQCDINGIENGYVMKSVYRIYMMLVIAPRRNYVIVFTIMFPKILIYVICICLFYLYVLIKINQYGVNLHGIVYLHLLFIAFLYDVYVLDILFEMINK